MCECMSMPVQHRITVEECKTEPSVEINRGLEDSLLKPALKKKLLELMSEVKILVF